jgi:hypothetical protein
MPDLSFSALIRLAVRGRDRGRRVTETPMDPIPEKLYYVPLPQLRHLHVRDLPLWATIGRGLRGRHDGHRFVEAWASYTRAVERWWMSHTVDEVVWMLALALAVVVAFVVARL